MALMVRMSVGQVQKEMGESWELEGGVAYDKERVDDERTFHQTKMKITKPRWYHNGLSHWRSGLAGVERLTVALLLSCVLERDAKVEAPQDEVGGAR